MNELSCEDRRAYLSNELSYWLDDNGKEWNTVERQEIPEYLHPSFQKLLRSTFKFQDTTESVIKAQDLARSIAIKQSLSSTSEQDHNADSAWIPLKDIDVFDPRLKILDKKIAAAMVSNISEPT